MDSNDPIFSINISREHSELLAEVQDCFKGVNIEIDAGMTRLSAADLPMLIGIWIIGNVINDVGWAVLKAGIRLALSKFKKPYVVIYADVNYSIRANEEVVVSVIPDRLAEFSHIKNLDNLIDHLVNVREKEAHALNLKINATQKELE